MLGRSFRLEDAAEMLDLLPGSLLAEVDEALEARIVVTDRDSIAFRHELLWQAVADSLPQPVARALHRQAGQMLLAHGEDAVAAARHLLAGAHRGDSVALAGLDRAVANAAQSAPTAAAELAVRVLDLTGPTDPGTVRQDRGGGPGAHRRRAVGGRGNDGAARPAAVGT